MAQQKTWEAMRSIAAARDGLRCVYCRVPTAATIEHLQARSKGGHSWAANLALACPYCNQRKSNRPIEVFIESGDWKLEPPADLPSTTREMLRECFGWDHSSGQVSTGSTNSKLELKGGKVFLLVRPNGNADWYRVLLGAQEHPAVAAASWDFLTRHFTPAKPKRKRPPKKRFR